MAVANIVIGKPIVELYHLLGSDDKDKSFIKDTFFTNNRFLPSILKELNLVPSISWVRKNKPELVIELNDLDFIKIQISKKKEPIWIVVGE